jgi:hypothetical protein
MTTDTDPTTTDDLLRTVAQSHADSCDSTTILRPGEGWLCSSCDDDTIDYLGSWRGTVELFQPDHRPIPKGGPAP